MKKRVIVTVVFLFVIIYAGQCVAGSGCDALWEKRIARLEATHGDKFSRVNNMRMCFKTSVPDPKYGESCRVIDLSTSKKMDSWRKSVKTIRKEMLGGEKAKGGNLIKLPWYFWPYKKFVKEYNEEINNQLPEGAQSLAKEMMKACATYDYCKKQKNNENIMFIFPVEAVLGMKVPAGNYDSKLHRLYLFLISEEEVQKIHKAS